MTPPRPVLDEPDAQTLPTLQAKHGVPLAADSPIVVQHC